MNVQLRERSKGEKETLLSTTEHGIEDKIIVIGLSCISVNTTFKCRRFEWYNRSTESRKKFVE